MLKNITTFFERHFLSSETNANKEDQLKLATASLLIEMMVQDHEISKVEKVIVQKILRDNFKLTDAETEELYDLAEQEAKQATDYHQFTRLIAQHFDQAQKIMVIEHLWRVSYSDQILNQYEEHMVRRIADLIHVSHH